MSATEIEYTESKTGKLELLAKASNWIRLIFIIPKFSSDVFWLITASIIINLLALALPLSLMQVYDRIIPNSSINTLAWLMIGVVSAIVLETIVKILRSFTSNWLSARLDHILNTEVLNYFLSARLDKYEQDKAGVHFERFNTIGVIKSYFSGQIFLILLDIPFAILFLSLVYYIGGFLCYFPLCLMAVFIVIILIAKRKFEKYNENQIDMNKENLDFVLETLGGIHTVKSLNMEDRMNRKFEDIQARVSSASLKANRWNSVPNNISQFFTQLNMLGIIFLGANLVIDGTLTIGAMTACTMLATRGLQPVLKVAGFWLRFSEVTIAQKQLKKIIDLKTPTDQIDIPMVRDVEGNVTFENVIWKEKKSDGVMPQFNAHIPAGEFIGVTGENPEQTTALMLLLCGMYKPASGNIFIDEYLISAMDHSHFNGRVGYLSGKGRLFRGTILENISMFKPEKREVALDAAALFGLDKFVADLPNGYESVVDQRSNESLPMGLIQRISFARALVTCPRVLIIDRTLSSLDKESSELILEIIETLRGKCTIFFVSDYGYFPLKVDQLIKCSMNEITIESIS